MGSSHYEACKASIKKYYLKNADKIKELRKIRYNHFKYYHENQDRINQYNKLRYHNLKSKIKCEICNNSEWLGKVIPLELHHIDGDRFNNQLDNLQIICPNCHAQTDNYRAKNIKNG